VQFSRPLKSRLGYGLLAATNAGRRRMYADNGSDEWREFWRQVGLCRYAIFQNAIMNFFVDDNDGHDDFVISLALCVNAAAEANPEPAGGIVPARRLYEDGRY
jgi:hypothetical protein